MPPATSNTDWPDATILLVYVALILGVTVLGNLFLALDIRRFFLSLRRRLVVIARPLLHHTPYWALVDQPPCLVALGLQMPCTEEEVLAAYREKVKSMHPDRGGDVDRFLRLQKHFEQAMYLARKKTQPG